MSLEMYSHYELTEQGREYILADFPPLPWWWTVIRIIYRSDFSPVIVFSFLFLLGIIANRWQRKPIEIAFSIVAVGVVLLPMYLYTTGSVSMFNLAVAFVMTATVFILNFVKLSILDYAIMFSGFAYLSRFIGIAQSFIHIRGSFGLSVAALVVMITISAVYKIRLGRLNGNLFYCWFTCMLVFINGYIMSHLFSSHVLQLGQAQVTRIAALSVWGVALIIACSLSALLIYAVKRLFKKHFDNINRMGKTYPLIERFIILNSVAILLLVGAAYFFFGRLELVSDPVYTFISARQNPVFEYTNLILLFTMILQLSFITIVFRMTWLRDNLKITTMEIQSLAAYSSGLEKNLNDIKNIKHDVKNIFLTMGNFVERSGDKEMQDFYNKKISPFAVDEIVKNDLLGKLAGLGNEQLKAFLFYKISQAVEHDVNVDLEILTRVTDFESDGRIEFIDLVRILGILLDNAIEECIEIPDGRIFIKISGNNETISCAVKNTVRQETKEKGIRPGESAKGKGRGKGLIGIRSILLKYDTVLLNSYFTEGCFVQNLVIYNANQG
ncbi:MAG: GHKL domain-containing protein [Defluviitaleaceae bacterium]|nr:GHKL domain-containing protein [Defluviitaleaceae bacterium]